MTATDKEAVVVSNVYYHVRNYEYSFAILGPMLMLLIFENEFNSIFLYEQTTNLVTDDILNILFDKQSFLYQGGV